MPKDALTLLLAAPRGFCAGVDRAIQIVELALQKFGPPVYVRHEIVHNRYVVEGLKAKGAVFVEELDEIPETDQPVIFSAHGVAKAVPEAARTRNLFHLDATCPLVTKVHREAEIHHRKGHEIVLIGHAGHPEVDGTMGQLPPGAITLIETEADARAFRPRRPDARLAFITQTTLSVDDTAAIVTILKERFPAIVAPHKEDICYATTNRQEAVKRIAGDIDAMIVIGAPNSSNSQRLREVAARAGCPVALLVQRAGDIDWALLTDIRRVGITAGASAPEVLVEEVIDAFAERFDVKVEVVTAAEEAITFNLPRALREAAE
jgi:4-hydroxy-3-methylbut-2-enyl diphosphate reductase